MWSREVTVQPTLHPVTLDEVRDQLRIEVPDEDAWIDAKIGEAVRKVEEFASKALMTQTMKLRLDGWPCSSIIRPPRPPLVSVSSIQYVDENGDTQTWSSSQYVVDAVHEPGRITLAYGQSFPSLRAIPNNVTVTYVAGHATRGDARLQPARAAIVELIALWREYREGVVLFGSASATAELEQGILRGKLNPDFRCYYHFGQDCG